MDSSLKDSSGVKSLTQSLIIADLSRSGVAAVLLAVAAGEQLVEVARAAAAVVTVGRQRQVVVVLPPETELLVDVVDYEESSTATEKNSIVKQEKHNLKLNK